MASSLQQLLLCFLCFSSHIFLIHGTYTTTTNQIPQYSYVVYMGSNNIEEGDDVEATALADHLGLLSSIIPSEESDRLSLIHSYHHAFKGFSALLTEEEASFLSGHERVVSVFRDPILQLQTTRSWDFLDSQSGIQANHNYPNVDAAGDLIIGIIDTGIWPESPSFNDHGMGEIPSKWKGVCMEGTDFKKSNCNRKLIGARYYSMSDLNSATPRDFEGHGTHTASTAAGALVTNASYYGLAKGTARGGSPSSRLAIYKACSDEGDCSGATVLKAIEDSIKDGVDVISISIGLNPNSAYLNDPIAIGAFHANEKGIMVICSAGNDGPDPYTVGNTAPWILTVGASTIDRALISEVVLGNGRVIHGVGINLSNLTPSKLYPLTFGSDIGYEFTPISQSSNCYADSLDPKKTAGKIVVCENTDPMETRMTKKKVVENAGGIGLILIEKLMKREAIVTGVFPFTDVEDMDGDQIIKYINSTKKPKATILSSVELKRSKPAPVVASFSSRGPGPLTESILKPDITAPGVGILAAMIPFTGNVPTGEKPSEFGIKSGTSMACPHVAGAATFIKSVHRDWTPSMIKSSLMTTATLSNNLGEPITNTAASFATWHEMGAGELNPLKALNPGLVYETTTKDYLNFLCHYGYKAESIESITRTVTKFSCPKNSIEDLISDMNYPTISISKLAAGLDFVRTITRTVTNVGNKNATYTAKVDSPRDLVVKVSPAKLVFSENSPAKASFRVSFSAEETSAKGYYRFGSVNWSDGKHFVRTVFAVNVS